MASSTAPAYCFAHLADPHLTTLEGVRWRELLNKRLLGYLSWRRRRRAEHRGEVLAALVEDLHRFRPGQILVAGDLTHVGLPAEFREAAAWLRRLGPPGRVFLVPGNHERYVAAPWRETFDYWREYLDGGEDETVFPIQRRAGEVVFFGVSSAIPTPPFLATGRVGTQQLARLEVLLREAGAAGLVRVLLIHHPPLARTVGPRKRLVDAEPLCRVLRKTGVELVLHGHTHRNTCGHLETAAGRVPVLGAASASALGHDPERHACYHLFRVLREGEARQLEVTVRAYDAGRRAFAERDRYRLWLPDPL